MRFVVCEIVAQKIASFLVEDRGHALPICHLPWRRLTPHLAPGRKEFILRRILRLAVGIEVHRSHQCLRFGGLGFEQLSS